MMTLPAPIPARLLIGLLPVLSACSMVAEKPPASPAPAPGITATESADPETVRAAAGADTSGDSTGIPVIWQIREPAGKTRAQADQTGAAPLPPSLWDRLRQGFTFPACKSDVQAQVWQRWYAGHEDYLQRALNRARPWLYLILEQLDRRNLPADFALLPLVESAFNVFALSPAGAHGAWQITAPTASDYGLEIRAGFDARRDMVLATAAALDLLQRLMQDFDGNWRLALAAYNGGRNRVMRALARHGGDRSDLNAGELRLPRETRTYAPKLHGLVCLLSDPDTAVELPEIADEPVIGQIDLERSIDLVEVAWSTGMDVAELYTLNAGLATAHTPAGGYRLTLPRNKLAGFRGGQDLANVKSLPEAVVVDSGDTLSGIAARHGASVATIMQANNLSSDRIRPGQHLLVASSGAAEIPGYTGMLRELNRLQASLPGVRRFRHRIHYGETLSTIADRYGVSVGQLQRWNNIRHANRIRAGNHLVVYGGQQHGQTAPERRHRVRRGDSLWRIARLYRLTVEQLSNWNGLDVNAILKPGQLIKLAP